MKDPLLLSYKAVIENHKKIDLGISFIVKNNKWNNFLKVIIFIG